MSVVRLMLVLIAVSGASCTHLAPSGRDPIDNDLALSRQILVTVRQQTTGAEGLVGDPATIYLRRPGYGATVRVDRVLRDLADDFDLARVDGWQIASLGVYCEVYQLRPGQDLDSVMRMISSDRRVESVQAMNLYQTEAVRYNDPYASMQPALSTLEIDAAHELATGRGIRVAVIDSSVDDRHPEIRGRVPIRRDLVRNRSNGEPEIHGTAVAGIIGSTANNHLGIVGVAPEVEIESFRACWTVDAETGRASCSSFSLARSLEEAIRAGADVINMSLSGPRDRLLQRLVDVALEQGIVVIAALPESVDDDVAFPASHPGVIAVRSAGSANGWGANAIIAPGNEVLTTTPGAEYAFFSGNSMASAIVAGVSALLLEREPGLDARDILRVLSQTSAAGSINACEAVARVVVTGGCRSATTESYSSRRGE